MKDPGRQDVSHCPAPLQLSFPMPHSAQLDKAVVEPYLPAAQSVQEAACAVENLPTTQSVQRDEPAAAAVPALHTLHEESARENFPPGQSTQAAS